MANKMKRKTNTTLKTKVWSNTNPTKTRVSSGAPEGKATPAPLVAPVVLLTSQNRCIVMIDASHNRYMNGFVFMTSEDIHCHL